MKKIILIGLLFLSGCGASVHYGAWGGARVPLGPHYLNGVNCEQFATASARAACMREYNWAVESARRRAEYDYEREAAEYGRRGAILDMGFPFYQERRIHEYYFKKK